MEKKFKLFNTEWKIEYVDSLPVTDSGTFQLGRTDYITHTISVAKTVNDVKLSKEDLYLTLMHEIVHSILGTGSYNSCSSDEPLVEWIANCLISLKEQKIL